MAAAAMFISPEVVMRVAVKCGVTGVCIHRLQNKVATIFTSNFAKDLPIFKILSPTDLAVHFRQAIMKYPTTPHTRRYTTL